jgi:3-hydroxybutyryl-CoA dehydrogenase
MPVDPLLHGVPTAVRGIQAGVTELVGIVGCGTMGAGIAQVALEHGHEVVMHDVDEAALDRARERILKGLGRRAAKLDLDADSIDAWVDGRLAGLRGADTLDAVAAEADVVVEAAVEDLELKRTIFRTLDRETATRPEVLLATNTSALSVAAIAAATARPERVVGLHFFNPAPLMALVEVVAPAGSDREVVERAATLVRSWDKTAIVCADAPGFIVNRVNRPFTLEALRLIEGGDASVAAIDEAIRAAGFPMGPFELMDLVGIDVNLAAARGVWEGLGRPDRLRPSAIQERLVADERYGRKSGAGFYSYDGGRRDGPTMEFERPEGRPDRSTPDEVVERIVLAVVNEAYLATGEGVAQPADIDVALRLGAGHPFGPFEWVSSRTSRTVVADLERLATTAGSRYEPAAGLRAAAEGCC